MSIYQDREMHGEVAVEPVLSITPIFVRVNEQPMQVAAGLSISALLQQCAVNPQGCALALNGQIVPRSCWGSTPLHDCDDVMLFQAIAGG
ncbi:MAG: sulfur carrier protein ThiS [Plesiomonas sp.]|uniref:sulfur carrier protein ThiS n=1 Tax=Plesiomonas sp. TaxID=2486279 RepID=UPI003F3DF8F9